MGSARERQLRRERKAVARRRAGREHNAEETRRQQASATLRRGYAHKRRRHITAASMWAVAGVMAITHGIEHAGALRIMSPGLEDLLIGWPMAVVLALAGAFVYGT